MLQPFSQAERALWLSQRREELEQYGQLMESIAPCRPWSDEESRIVAAAQAHLTSAGRAAGEYFSRLPRLAMGCCPFDGKPLFRSLDPYGLDGLWWRSDATPTEVPSCPHFCMLRGGVSFKGHPPQGADFEAHTGPEVPYVIPRILDQPGVVAVISRLEMTPGYTVYLIAYFAQRRPPVQELAANWPRTIFLYTTAGLDHRWRFDHEAWDFDLRPWLAKDKLRWCDDASKNERLSLDPADRCPYVDLPGERRASVVIGSSRRLVRAPDGRPPLPVG